MAKNTGQKFIVFWAVYELGMNMAELFWRLNILVLPAGVLVKR